MQTNGYLRHRIFQHTVLDHRKRAFADLLGRLEHKLDAPGNFVALPGQHFGDAQCNRGVAVVTAGVHLARCL